VISQAYQKIFSMVLSEIGSSERGLTQDEAKRRLQNFGLNILPEAKGEGWFLIILRQFKSPLIYVLVAASLAVFALGEPVDGSIILFVLSLNAIIGAWQEGKAQNTLLALKKFSETSATVIRDEKEVILPDAEVVPGDIIIVQEGEKVPADARVIAFNNLTVSEAALTGESWPIHKVSEEIEKEGLSPADQRNMLFKGTIVLVGHGRAVVVGTGANTVIGRISTEIAAIDSEIPLHANMRSFSKVIIGVVVFICAALFIVGIAAGYSLKEMFMVVVSLSVSVIPEGLPVVLTLILATGVWRMSKRHALVKKLHAVEALGQARVIAVDKTGTITKNEMTVKEIYANGRFFRIGGNGYAPQGGVLVLDSNSGHGSFQPVSPPDFEEIMIMGRVAAFSSNARVTFVEKTGEWHVAGDPTEAALLVFARKVGFVREELRNSHNLLDEIPFDHQSKMHSTLQNSNHSVNFLTVVGAPETVLNKCKKIWQDGAERPLEEKVKGHLESTFIKMSKQGLRTLACAIAYPSASTITNDKLNNLTLVGFYGISDELRAEVKESAKLAGEAGIRVVMITGDHKDTAKAIAKEAGIFNEGDMVITGVEMDKMSLDDLQKIVSHASVFARVTPEHKLKIIEAFKRRGEIVAMTGDGVNDAPSLVAADLGVAMGKIGTEVAKEAADIILLDDNFGSIVSAVEEGRSIYKTIKKVILYLFSTNLGEVLTIAFAFLLGMPLPILAAQIIWLNLITDSFLDVGLAMEPKEKDILSAVFKRPSKYILDKMDLQRMFFMAIPMVAGTLFLFQRSLNGDYTKAITIAMTTLAVFQWFNVFNCRSERKSIFAENPFKNRYLGLALVVVVLLQVAAVYHPFLQKILRTTALSWREWTLIGVVALSIIAVEEIRKAVMRLWDK